MEIVRRARQRRQIPTAHAEDPHPTSIRVGNDASWSGLLVASRICARYLYTVCDTKGFLCPHFSKREIRGWETDFLNGSSWTPSTVVLEIANKASSSKNIVWKCGGYVPFSQLVSRWAGRKIRDDYIANEMKILSHELCERRGIKQRAGSLACAKSS